jgi:phosphatidylserine synthase
MRAGFAADLLTATRLGLALPIFFAAGMGFSEPVAVMLAAAWWTDFFDGHLARRAGGKTRLGDLDTFADVTIASALLAGEVAAGTPPLWGAVGLVLLAMFVARHNTVWCVLLQAVAYGLVLARLLTDAPVWSVLPLMTALTMLWLNRQRFIGEFLPRLVGTIAPAVGTARKA